MNVTDMLTDIKNGARTIDTLEAWLARTREAQDASIVTARQAGIPWADIVVADGRSRQMLNRLYRAATE